MGDAVVHHGYSCFCGNKVASLGQRAGIPNGTFYLAGTAYAHVSCARLATGPAVACQKIFVVTASWMGPLVGGPVAIVGGNDIGAGHWMVKGGVHNTRLYSIGDIGA